MSWLPDLPKPGPLPDTITEPERSPEPAFFSNVTAPPSQADILTELQSLRALIRELIGVEKVDLLAKTKEQESQLKVQANQIATLAYQKIVLEKRNVDLQGRVATITDQIKTLEVINKFAQRQFISLTSATADLQQQHSRDVDTLSHLVQSLHAANKAHVVHIEALKDTNPQSPTVYWLKKAEEFEQHNDQLVATIMWLLQNQERLENELSVFTAEGKEEEMEEDGVADVGGFDDNSEGKSSNEESTVFQGGDRVVQGSLPGLGQG